MPLSRRGYRVPKYSNMRSDPDIIGDVRALGVHAVSLANNHMMDYGPDAMFDTLQTCDQASILRCGAGVDLDAALKPSCLTVGDATIGLLSVACTLPVESDAAPDKPGIAPIHVHFSFEVDTNLLAEQPGTMPHVHSWVREADRDRVCNAVSALKRSADLVVVAIHWGVPNYWLSPAQGYLATYQRPLARDLVNAGADVVCGTHSHSLHPIEVVNGKPVFYSLGNFLFEDPRGFMEPEGIIVRVAVDSTPELEMVPLIIDERGFPRLAKGDEASHVFSKLAKMSAPFGTTIDVRGERGYIAWDGLRREA
jgi:poly-gamma-glutamate capsule biosynthesis protein CapA/YwtB (metallophosphatase superfamily)